MTQRYVHVDEALRVAADRAAAKSRGCWMAANGPVSAKRRPATVMRTRGERLEGRITTDQKSLIQRAADLEGRSGTSP